MATQDGGNCARSGRALWTLREELCKRVLKTNEHKTNEYSHKEGEDDEQSRNEVERKRRIMQGREKLKIWDPGWGNQLSLRIVGDSNLVITG